MANNNRERMNQPMSGRRSPDDLSGFCVFVALILIIVGLFVPAQSLLSWIAIALVAYAVWRMYSKNAYKRLEENNAFLKALGPVRPWVQNPKAAWTEKRTYKHVKCTKCGQKVRVPRGKGRLRVTCPSCGEKFEVKS